MIRSNGGRWRVEQAQWEHIPFIAENMREADRREVSACDGHTPEQALFASLNNAVLAWTCFVDGLPAFMWGVGPADARPDIGQPWLLGTGAIHEVSFEFLKQSRPYVELMQERFSRLENHVHAGNRLSLRWLHWCGFTVEKDPVSINREPFFPFWRIGE